MVPCVFYHRHQSASSRLSKKFRCWCLCFPFCVVLQSGYFLCRRGLSAGTDLCQHFFYRFPSVGTLSNSLRWRHLCQHLFCRHLLCMTAPDRRHLLRRLLLRQRLLPVGAQSTSLHAGARQHLCLLFSVVYCLFGIYRRLCVFSASVFRYLPPVPFVLCSLNPPALSLPTSSLPKLPLHADTFPASTPSACRCLPQPAGALSAC